MHFFFVTTFAKTPAQVRHLVILGSVSAASVPVEVDALAEVAAMAGAGSSAGMGALTGAGSSAGMGALAGAGSSAGMGALTGAEGRDGHRVREGRDGHARVCVCVCVGE